MKRLIALLMLLFSASAFAQDVTWTPAVPFLRDTLTATIDTIDVVLTEFRGSDYFSVVAYTTTGTDTVQIYTLTMDGLTWVQQGLVDISSNTDVTQIVVTTVAKEFLILDVAPKKIRFITDDASASCIVVLSGKKVGR